MSSEKHETAVEAGMEEGCPRRRGDHHGGGWLPASGRAPKAQQPHREARKKIEIQDAREIVGR